MNLAWATKDSIKKSTTTLSATVCAESLGTAHAPFDVVVSEYNYELAFVFC